MRPVLVVDDERFILDSVAFVLEQEGIPFATAGTGREALRVAETERPAVVLLDVMLPDVLGWDVCRELRRRASGEPPHVIMLSARGQATDVEQGRKAGADDYIVKPFSPAVLVGKIKRVLAAETA